MDLNDIKRKYDIVGSNPRLLDALHKAVQVAPTDLSILVLGESGVGKEVFARILHDFSGRKHGKLVPVNCGALPEGTIESELFGHVQGAFTGADKNRRGYFEEANGGTIFLDEVGELPRNMQVKLLRVLENREIIPVGASTPRKVDVRVVAATNVDLVKSVREGHFREDLFYRLNQISIHIPPLRERKEDIRLLFRKFASDAAEQYNIPPVKLDEQASEFLSDYPWYGNVRELRNIASQIAVIETDRVISRPVLQSYLKEVSSEKMPALTNAAAPRGEHSDRELLFQALSMGKMISEMRNEINQLKQAVSQLAQGLPISSEVVSGHCKDDISLIEPHNSSRHPYVGQVEPDDMLSDDLQQEFKEAEVLEDESLHLDERERVAIRKALERHNGKRKEAAKELGISERTLYRKLNEYDIK